MKTEVLSIITCLAILISIFFLFKYLTRLEKKLHQLLGLTGSLRLRVFEQEIRQLSSPGIFVHEDIAEKISSILLSLMSNEQKETLEKNYKENNIPQHIPLWKYFLYNYTFSIKTDPRYDHQYSSIPEIQAMELVLATKNISDQFNSVKALTQLIKSTEEEVNKISEKIEASGNDQSI